MPRIYLASLVCCLLALAASRFSASVHAIALIGSDGLTTIEGTHLDSESQSELGDRFAKRMIELQATPAATPKPPSDIKFIDPHVHAMSVTPLGLRAVAKWMDERNVERCIVSPLNHKGSRPQNEEERQTMLENFRPYKGRIDPGEVKTFGKAVAILKREIADGAVGFGEHFFSRNSFSMVSWPTLRSSRARLRSGFSSSWHCFAPDNLAK